MVRYERNKDDKLDLIARYLPRIQKIEGLDPMAYRSKSIEISAAEGNEAPMADEGASSTKESEEAREARAKAARRKLFTQGRFEVEKAHEYSGELTVEGLVRFVHSCRKGEQPYAFHSHQLKSRAETKIVGDDFEAYVYKRPAQDSLVFFRSSDKDRDHEAKAAFDAFAEKNAYDNTKLLVGSYSAINENSVFKAPESTPCVGYFRAGDKGRPVYLQVGELLRREKKTQEELRDLINDFVMANKTFSI